VSESSGESLPLSSVMSIDISGFAQGMLQSQAIAAIFPATITNFIANPLLGLIGVAKDAASAIQSAFLGVAGAADNAGESAQKLGVSAEFLTGMGRAAADAGASMGGFEDALKFVNKNAAEAAGGSKEATAAFASIGVSVTNASGQLKGTEQLYQEVAAGINSLPDAATRTQAAMQLMGRSGTDMLAALGSMSELQPLFKQLGANIDEGLAASGDKFGTLQTVVGAAIDGVKNSLARPILDAFAGNFDAIVERIVAFSDTIRPAVEQIGNAIAPLILPAIDVFTSLASTIAGGVSAAVAGLGPVLAGVLPLVSGLASVVGAVLVPAFALLTPVLQGVGQALRVIGEIVGGVLSGVGQVVSAITGGLGGGSALSPFADLGGAAVAAGAPAGAGSRTTNYTIDGVYVPPIDVNEATSSIAQKVAPHVRDAILRQQDQLSAVEEQAATKGGL
jgi:phage-related protein